MSGCPVCRAAWPEPVAGASCAVCPVCYMVFNRDAAGAWRMVAPVESAASAPAVPLNATLEVAGHAYRLIGCAEWSYEVEQYRDTFKTLYRRKFTLVNSANESLAVFGSDEDVWWLVQERPSHTIDRALHAEPPAVLCDASGRRRLVAVLPLDAGIPTR
ncbi:MAG: hypothetical protein FJW31_27805 [Acidobacteria bacterium]|nr:hypothetical protein [Acidobacteriota bacterium]